jgi:hypothetical protein
MKRCVIIIAPPFPSCASLTYNDNQSQEDKSNASQNQIRRFNRLALAHRNFHTMNQTHLCDFIGCCSFVPKVITSRSEFFKFLASSYGRPSL